MTDRHYSREEIERYADDPSSFAERTAMEEHLTGCSACAAELQAVRIFVDALRSEEAWQFGDDARPSRGLDLAVKLAARIKREDADAERLLGRYMHLPFRFLWRNVPRRRTMQTGGVVRLLCRSSQAVREKDPLHARNLADIAVAVAEALPNDYYPGRGVYHLRGLAHKERANALRYLGDLHEALLACASAAAAYRHLPTGDLELAAVRFVEGTVLWKQQRFAEALDAAQESAAAAAQLRDRELWTKAKLLEGSVLTDANDATAALDVFLALRSDVDVMADPLTAGRTENNLASAYLELGRVGEASMHFIAALQLFESVGASTEAVRVRWSLGYLALRAGNPIEAERRLRAAYAECQARKMATDAALVLLDLVEALVSLGHHEEVLRLCRDLVDQFRAAGMLPAALSAAAFLREAAASRRISTSQTQYVRNFLRRLDSEPSLLFSFP